MALQSVPMIETLTDEWLVIDRKDMRGIHAPDRRIWLDGDFLDMSIWTLSSFLEKIARSKNAWWIQTSSPDKFKEKLEEIYDLRSGIGHDDSCREYAHDGDEITSQLVWRWMHGRSPENVRVGFTATDTNSFRLKSNQSQIVPAHSRFLIALGCADDCIDLNTYGTNLDGVDTVFISKEYGLKDVVALQRQSRDRKYKCFDVPGIDLLPTSTRTKRPKKLEN